MVRTRGGHTGSSSRTKPKTEDVNWIYIDSEDSNEEFVRNRDKISPDEVENKGTGNRETNVLNDVTNTLENTTPITIHSSSIAGGILRHSRPLSGKENEVLGDPTKFEKEYTPVKKRVKIIMPIEEDVEKLKEKVNGVHENHDDSPERKRKPPLERGQGLEYEMNDDALINAIGAGKRTPTARRSRKAFDHWLLIRFQPRVFSDALSSLSENQRKWVRKTGFESLLSFCMNEYPHALGYYLVLSFQKDICSLVHENITLSITEEDVNEVLGLPKGPKLLQIIRSKHIEDKWRSQYKSVAIKDWKVTANMVCEAIKATKEVDRTFKLNFLILMCNILIEGPCGSYVRQDFLGFSGDIDNCNEYNWCEYLIRCLKVASLRWLDNPDATKFYTGSLPFLVYFYLDRVVQNKRQVKRSKPTFIGWTDSLILDRQILELSSGIMFRGRIAKPLRDKDSDDESTYENYTWNKVDDFDNDGGGEKSVNKVTGQQMNTENTSKDIFDNLKISLDEYEKFQEKFMKDLVSAKALFGDNSCVAMEALFINLNKKATNFVENEIKHQKQETVKVHSELDEDICFTPEDWRIIDSYSVPRVAARTNSVILMKSMESQSKNLSLELDNGSTGFKTPSQDNRNKLPSDMIAPTFDLNIDFEKETSLSMTKIEANVPVHQVKSDNQVVHNGVIKSLLDRPRRGYKMGDKCKSPFFDRCTNIRSRVFKKEELEFWNWLHSSRKHPNRIVFKWNGITCYKLDFQSMNDGEMVLTSIMDVWCCFLNSMEEYRSSISPKRLFCFTETTVGTLNAIDKNTIERKYSIFEENMDHVFNTYGTTLNEVDLIFFPIHNVNHYYVVCFNLKNPSMDILDNKYSKDSINELYGHQIDVMHTHFVKYLGVKKHRRLMEVSRLKPQRLCMNWQTKINGVDCGIFAMIHMESYMGGGSRGWDSKLAVESYTQGQQIHRFRVVGTYRMFTSPLNEWYNVILDEVNCPDLSKYLPDAEKAN